MLSAIAFLTCAVSVILSIHIGAARGAGYVAGRPRLARNRVAVDGRTAGDRSIGETKRAIAKCPAERAQSSCSVGWYAGSACEALFVLFVFGRGENQSRHGPRQRRRIRGRMHEPAVELHGEAVAIGLVFGAFFGAKLAHILTAVQLRRGFAVFLVVVAIRVWTTNPR